MDGRLRETLAELRRSLDPDEQHQRGFRGATGPKRPGQSCPGIQEQGQRAGLTWGRSHGGLQVLSQKYVVQSTTT